MHSNPVEPACISARLDASMGRQDHTIHRPRLSRQALAGPRTIRASFSEAFGSAVRRAPDDAHGEHPPCDPCAPDAVASIASHRAFVTCATPLRRVRRANLLEADLPDVLSDLFLRKGLDGMLINRRFARRVRTSTACRSRSAKSALPSLRVSGYAAPNNQNKISGEKPSMNRRELLKAAAVCRWRKLRCRMPHSHRPRGHRAISP